jgi:predicted TPR repeat methyltransferase
LGRRQIHEDVLKAKTTEDLMKVYGKWAKQYDNDLLNEMGYKAPAATTAIFQKNNQDKSNAILDVGCGTGIIGAILSGNGYDYIDGLDYSGEMLEQAAKKGIYKNLIQGDLNDTLEINDDSYSAIISVGTFTLGHVRPHALKELVRITKPAGIICFTVRSEAWEQHNYSDLTGELENQGRWKLVEKHTIEYIQEENSTCEVLLYRVS